MNSHREKKINIIAYAFIAATVVLLLLYILFGRGGSNDIEVSWGGKVIGLKCTDSTLLHPALRDRTPISHTNTIMANFADDKLSTITIYYIGTYSSSLEAEQAEAFAQADYGLILAKEYEVSVDFTHSFMIDGEKVSMTITAKDGGVDDKTAPYFLLEQNKAFPKSLDEMKKRYEEKNFSCEITE